MLPPPASWARLSASVLLATVSCDCFTPPLEPSTSIAPAVPPAPASIVTLCATAPTPGYGVEEAANWITSPRDAHANAACTVPNGADCEFDEHTEPEPEPETNQVLWVAAVAEAGSSARKAATEGRAAARRDRQHGRRRVGARVRPCD